LSRHTPGFAQRGVDARFPEEHKFLTEKRRVVVCMKIHMGMCMGWALGIGTVINTHGLMGFL